MSTLSPIYLEGSTVIVKRFETFLGERQATQIVFNLKDVKTTANSYFYLSIALGSLINIDL